MNLLAKGGYGTVYVNNQRTNVVKVQPLYRQGSLDFSGLCEIAFLHAIHRLHGAPRVNSVSIEDAKGSDFLTLTMPYYGVSAHDWYQNTPFCSRAPHVPHIILQLCQFVSQLHELGVQHTDLKPTNILIDANRKATLIDYNICAVSVVGARRPANAGSWTTSIGTWAYVAPEICEHNMPTDTSAVWSLGVLMACLYDGHPLRAYFLDKDWDWEEHATWSEFWSHMRSSNTEMPVSGKMPPCVSDLYVRCTQLDPANRPSLQQMCSLLHAMCFPLSRYTPLTPPMQSITMHLTADAEGRMLRRRDLLQMHRWCTTWHLSTMLCRAIGIYDRQTTCKHPIICPAAALGVVYILHGNYLCADDAAVKGLCDEYGTTLERLEVDVVTTMRTLLWDTYDLPADVILARWLPEEAPDSIIARVFDCMVNHQEPAYTMNSIAMQALMSSVRDA